VGQATGTATHTFLSVYQNAPSSTTNLACGSQAATTTGNMPANNFYGKGNSGNPEVSPNRRVQFGISNFGFATHIFLSCILPNVARKDYALARHNAAVTPVSSEYTYSYAPNINLPIKKQV